MLSFRGKKINLTTFDFLFFALVFAYLFYTYSPWLTNDPIVTVTADLNHHISHYYSFAQHLSENKWWYPIDYTRDNDGFYWYFVLPLQYVLPLLLAFFLPFYLSFFFFYILCYFFLVAGIYLFLRSFSHRFIAALLSSFLLIGPFLNLIFSVGGNYHFFIGLTFFIFTLYFFHHFVITHEKKYLIPFTIFFILLGATYFFSLLIFLFFALVYLAFTKNFKQLVYLLLLTGTLSLFFVPTTIQTLTFEEDYQPLTLSQLLTTHVLPKQSLTSWLYMTNPPYDSTRDQNHGPHIYLTGLLALGLLLFLYKEKNPHVTFLLIFFLAHLALVLFPYTTSIIPSERLMVHTYLAFFFLTAYALNLLRINIYAFLAVMALGIGVISQAFFQTQMFFFTILIGILTLYLFWKKETHTFAFTREPLALLLGFVFLFLILFPITGSVEGTTLYPRVNYFTLPNIKDVIQPTDTIYFQGGFTMEHPLLAYSMSQGALGSGGASRDRAVSKQPELDVYSSSETTQSLIQLKGITKLLIPVELIQSNGQLQPEKFQHLVQWFGNPTVYNAAFRTYKHSTLVRESPYPLLVFTIPPAQKPYTLMQHTPIHFTLTKNADDANVLLNLQYNSWWHATSNGKEIAITNTNGYITFTNVTGIATIDLRFSMFWFYLGRILSAICLFLILIALRTYEHIPTTLQRDEWKTYLRHVKNVILRKKHENTSKTL